MGFFKDFFMGSEGTPAEHGIDVAYIDDYPDYAGVRKSLIDYWGGLLAGEEPEWLGKYSDQLLGQTMTDIERDYLGDPGLRSTSGLGLAAQMDAARGTGGTAFTRSAASDLLAKKAAARAASAGYRQQYMGQAVNRAGEAMLGLPQSQQYAASGYSIPGTSGSPGWLKESFGSLMSNIGPKGFDKALDFISGTFGSGTDFSTQPTLFESPKIAGSKNIPLSSRDIQSSSSFGGQPVDFSNFGF